MAKKVFEKLFEKSRKGLRAANFMYEQQNQFDDEVAFFIQQSIEKAIKAVLTYRKIRVEKTHSLRKLTQLLQDEELSSILDQRRAKRISDYIIISRYSDHGLTPIDPSELKPNLELAQKTIEICSKLLTHPKPDK